MVNEKYLYSDLTEKVIGCAMKVHNKLGNGYREDVYQRCLAIEITKIGLKYESEVEMPIYYDEFKVGMRRVDLLVENKIVVELKAIKEVCKSDWAQTINNLESSKFEVGLLINFGGKKLQFKRFINSKFKNIKSGKSVVKSGKSVVKSEKISG